jgi:hypothetical protein
MPIFNVKGINLLSVLKVGDTNRIYAVASDRQIKEINSPTDYKSLDAGSIISQIALNHNQNIFFAAVHESQRPGSIKSYNYPLTGNFTEIQVI